MGFSLDQYLSEKKRRKPGQPSTETTTTPTGGRASGGGGFSLDGYIQERGIRTGQLQKQDNDFNAWLGDLDRFATRISSDYGKRKDTYQSQDDFRAYQEKTGAEVADLLQRAKAAKSYYTQYGKIYDETRGEGVSSKVLEGIDQNISYLEEVQKSLKSEGEWRGQFLDRDDFDYYQQMRKGMEASKGEKWTFTPMTQSALSDNRPLSERILAQSPIVNKQVEKAAAEAQKDARARDRAAGGYAAAFGGTKTPVDDHPIASTYAAAHDAYQSEGQKTAAEKAAALGQLQDRQTALSRAYYVAENEEQRERILKDKPMWEKYLSIGDLHEVMSMAAKVAADAQNPGSGGEPAHIQQFKERLEREYGITQEAIDNYALYGDDDSVPADGKYTNISQFIHQLERAKQEKNDELKAAGYDYQRMTDYQQRRKDRAEAIAKAEMRRRAAREDPFLTSLGTVVVKPLQLGEYGWAALSSLGHSDPSDPKSYIPINTDAMDITNAVNTTRGEVGQMMEEEAGPVGRFLYNTGMSIADFRFLAGITGTLSGGGKAASNLALNIMGSEAAATTTVNAVNRGLSNRQALTLGSIAGIAEILTERISLGKLLDKTSLGRSRLGYFVENVVTEGLEEGASDVINWAADVLVSRDKSEWRQAIAAYQANGMDENTAFWHAMVDQAAAIGVDMLGGMLSGGVLAGEQIARDVYGDWTVGRDFRRSLNGADGLDQAVIDVGQESDPASDSYRLAQRYREQLDKRGRLTDSQLGRLYRANIAAIEAEGNVVDTPAAQNPVEGVKNAPTEGAVKRASDRDTYTVIQKLGENISTLNKDTPVAKVSASAVDGIGGKTMAEKARTLFSYIKGVVTRSGFGDVEINDRSAKDDLSHGVGPAKAMVIPAIPEVIRKGRQIDFQENWKGRGYDGYVFAAPVELDGETVFVAAVVKQTSKNRFYLHEVVDSRGNIIKMSNGESATQTSLAADGDAGTQSPLPTESITQTPPVVKPQSAPDTAAGLGFQQGLDAGESRVERMKDALQRGAETADADTSAPLETRLRQERGIPQVSDKGGDAAEERSKQAQTMLSSDRELLSVGEDGTIISGAISGALNPDGEEAEQHAIRYYKAVRKMRTDVLRIARNTGYAKNRIQRIKNFLFVDVHDLGGGRIAQFDPSYEISQSWQRLIDGKEIQPHDLTLLMHELMENDLMDKGYTQDEAHKITSKKYNYKRECEEYYGQTEEHLQR